MGEVGGRDRSDLLSGLAIAVLFTWITWRGVGDFHLEHFLSADFLILANATRLGGLTCHFFSPRKPAFLPLCQAGLLDRTLDDPRPLPRATADSRTCLATNAGGQPVSSLDLLGGVRHTFTGPPTAQALWASSEKQGPGDETSQQEQGSGLPEEISPLFLDREEGREKERERNINVWLLLVHPLLGT